MRRYLKFFLGTLIFAITAFSSFSSNISYVSYISLNNVVSLFEFTPLTLGNGWEAGVGMLSTLCDIHTGIALHNKTGFFDSNILISYLPTLSFNALVPINEGYLISRGIIDFTTTSGYYLVGIGIKNSQCNDGEIITFVGLGSSYTQKCTCLDIMDTTELIALGIVEKDKKYNQIFGTLLLKPDHIDVDFGIYLDF